jgi:4-hydroxyacetophenone monooxygenase
VSQTKSYSYHSEITDMSNPDEILRDAIECANLPTLLAVMSHLSGDEKWLSAPYLPNPVPPELLADDSA